MYSSTRWLALPAALLLVGCGARELPKEKVIPVRGKVLLNGTPLCMGLVELTPATPGQGRPATAIIDARGEFALQTYSNEEPDGAVPGEYKVAVKTFNSTDGGVLPAGVTPTKIPQRYADPDSSGLALEITEDKAELTIDLQE